MSTPMLKRNAVLMTLIGLVCWGTLGLAGAQTAPLISACVDAQGGLAQGRLRLVPEGTSCGAGETLMTWSAANHVTIAFPLVRNEANGLPYISTRRATEAILRGGRGP